MENDRDRVRHITDAVLSNPKYRDIGESFILAIANGEVLKRRNLKEAIKGTKNKLHQVAGAYVIGQRDYDKWLRDIAQAYHSGSRADFLQVCVRVMHHHASTKERLPFLQDFYRAILSDLPPVHSVLDIACGLNPLAIPWMPLAPHAEYYAYDIYGNLMEFLNKFLGIIQVPGDAQIRDISNSVPNQAVDVALILKTIPCIEQVDKTAGHRLLERIKAHTIVVSFPIHSLGGRNRGMVESYSQRFRELTRDKNWEIRRFDFPTELVFRITTSLCR